MNDGRTPFETQCTTARWVFTFEQLEGQLYALTDSRGETSLVDFDQGKDMIMEAVRRANGEVGRGAVESD